MIARRALLFLALTLFGVGAARVLAFGDLPPTMLLVASPRLADPRFQQSVVLVLRHGRGGPLGVIVNKGSDVTLATVFRKPDDSALARKTLHFGGPIEPRRLIALYRHAEPQPREALQVADGLWMSQSESMIARVLERPPESYKILAGFSGWAPGQLEREIARGDWYLMPLDSSVLFGTDDDKLWQLLLRQASERQAGAEGVAPRVDRTAAMRGFPNSIANTPRNT